MIKVKVSMDRLGCLTLTPLNKKVRAKYRKHMVSIGADPDPTVFLQFDYDIIDAFMASLRSNCRAGIEKGWDVVILMDPHDYGMLLGWDVCKVEV